MNIEDVCKTRDFQLATLIAISEFDSEGYRKLGFEIKDNENVSHLVCTVKPNWEFEMPRLGEIGILDYEIAIAGKTTYVEAGIEKRHTLTTLYFNSFTPKIIQSNEYKLTM